MNTLSTPPEFDLVKSRLRRIENKNKLDDKKSAGDKPTLRTRTETQPPHGQHYRLAAACRTEAAAGTISPAIRIGPC